MDTSFLPDTDGTIELTGKDGFGWEERKYNDAETKANYCAIYACGGYPKDFKSEKLAMLADVLKEQTGAEKITFAPEFEDCGIDHQSFDVADEVFESKEKLRQFIFNRNSWLFTCNDNSSPEANFYDVPVYHKDKVVQPEYKYEFVMDILKNAYPKKQRVFLKKKPTKEEIQDILYSLFDYEDKICVNIESEDRKPYLQDGKFIRSMFGSMHRVPKNDSLMEYEPSYRSMVDMKNKKVIMFRELSDQEIKENGLERFGYEKEVYEKNLIPYAFIELDFELVPIKKAKKAIAEL